MSSDHRGLFRRAAGFFFLLVGITALVYSIRAAVSQSMYHRLKFGRLMDETPERQQPVAELADRWYPHNYYLSVWMAERYWSARRNAGADLADSRISLADQWCRRGLVQNAYRRDLRWLEVELAGRISVVNACELWEKYVAEAAFWDPWNLASLAVLRAGAGRIESAMELLPLLRGTPSYQRAWTAIQSALRRQSVPPS